MPNDALNAAVAHFSGLEPEQRDQQLAQLQLRVAKEASTDSLEVPAPISSLAEYVARDLPIPPVLVLPTLLVRGELLATIGRAGKGKTSMNLHRIFRWAAGQPMFRELPDVLVPPDNKPLKTLIIENEGSAGMFQKKMKTMLGAEDFLTEDEQKVAAQNILIWGDGGWSGMKLDDDKSYNMIRRGAEKWKPDLIFIEPFRGLWRGNENDATEMGEVCDRFAMLATEYECAISVSHHERKSGAGEDGEKMSAGRGSTVLEGYAAVMENFGKAKGNDQRELDWSKSRYDPMPPAIRMKWDPIKSIYVYVAPEKNEAEVMAFIAQLNAPVTVKMIEEELGETNDRARKTLNALVDDGRLKKMKSRSVNGGPTGLEYRLAGRGDEEDNGGGMSFG